MLDRGLNGLRMFPVPADVRRLMYKVKHAQGTDITRIFCGLNDVRNIIPSIKYAIEGGMTPQATLCITTSPIHTAEYYCRHRRSAHRSRRTRDLPQGHGRYRTARDARSTLPHDQGKHPEVIIEYHGHNRPLVCRWLRSSRYAATVATSSIPPLSPSLGVRCIPTWISVQSMLKNAGFDVPEINMDAYMEARKLTQEFIDEWLGYFINPGNKLMSSLLLGCGLPGGMMGSMMADLAGVREAINANRQKKGEEPLSEDALLVKLFDEVAYVWPRVAILPS